MSLLSDLRTYVTNKGNSPEDAVKTEFFAGIIQLMEEDKLTVAELTNRLSLVNRKALFWLGRKKDKSPNSQAAKLVADLYYILNVPLDDISLATIVDEGISEANEQRLTAYNYHYWEKHPLSKVAKKALERDLKGLLEVNGPTYKDQSLAQSLAQFYRRGFNQLDVDIATLFDSAPAYLPTMLHDLYSLYLTKSMRGEENKATEFVEELVRIVQDNPRLFESVSKAHPHLAAALVKEFPTRFFELPASLQNEVQKLLGEDTAAEVTNFMVQQYPLVGIEQNNINLMVDLLHSPKLRADMSEVTHRDHGLFTQLNETICNSLASDGTDKLIALHQAEFASQEIKKYLLEGPNQYKTNFFRNLAADINQHGLTVELLNEHMKGADKKALFAKWSGAHNSRAAGLMFELYKMANMTNRDEDIQFIRKNLLDPKGDELHEMIDSLYEDSEDRKAQFLNEVVYPNLRAKVDQVLLHPEQAHSSPLAREIDSKVQDYVVLTQFAKRDLALLQKNAEAVYQNYLLKKGLQLARDAEPQKLIFDPQGHVIISVQLEDDDYAEICRQITGEEGNKEALQKLLGASITTTTLCNLDIAKDDQLKTAFKNRVGAGNVLDAYLDSSQRSSVIALQEEMMMHVSLSLRALEHSTKLTLLTDEQRAALMLEINTKVLQKFAAILTEVSPGNSIDYVRLNKKLDEARTNLAKLSRESLVDAIQEALTPEDFKNLSDWLAKPENLNDHTFTSITATGLDYFHTDATNESAIHISATDKTAHNKQIGADELALRVIARCHYNPSPGVENAVTEDANRTIEARVPSIAIKSGSHHDAVKDVAAKLGYAQGILKNKNQAYTGPVIYNLLTSLHTKAYDNFFFERSNKQRASAARILKGSHLYNFQQLGKGEANALVYVQNIPVNQHTNALSYEAFDGATREAAVMTDLALLATLSYHSAVFSAAVGQSITAAYDAAHTRYVHFLPEAQDGDHYFKDSDQGKRMMKELIGKKSQWRAMEPMMPADNLHALVVQTLFKMMANNEHQNKQFGMLSQALSVFLEPASLAGCKSANEREQAVAGRVGLLRSINSGRQESLSEEKKAVIEALANYVSGAGTIAAVQEKVDVAYDKHNLQGAVAAVSMEDQAASSKVKATENEDNPGVVSEFDTNYAESGYLEHLSQKHSSEMQAHKANLTEEFTGLFAAKVAEMQTATMAR